MSRLELIAERYLLSVDRAKNPHWLLGAASDRSSIWGHRRPRRLAESSVPGAPCANWNAQGRIEIGGKAVQAYVLVLGPSIICFMKSIAASTVG
jgi:hypothetical protein